jgi:hypothetical protein
MLRHEIEECKEIARLIAREEIAKAIADFKKPVVASPAAPAPEKEQETVTSHRKKL